jgi:Mg2+ and Co2+ transporter CorA
MKHRMLRMPAGWEWHMLTDGRAPSDWLVGPRTGPSASGTEQARPGTGTADAGQPGAPGSGSDTARPETEPAGEAGAPGSEPGDAILTAGMTRAAALTAIKRRFPECANWLDDSMERRDTLAVSTETPEAGDTLYGTLPLRMSHDEQDVCPLHFWVTEKRLVTLMFDLRFMLRLQRSPWEERLGRAANAPEAFAVILTAALETLRGGFEAFERRLDGLEETAERSGLPIPAETIAELQRGLLQWNRHLLAVVEAESAAAESFGKRLTDGEPYRRLQRRLGLVRALIGRHAGAIDTLAALGGAAAARKSGTLLRSLGAVALLPLPAAAAGALWGMYAGGVTVADEPWGFAAVCGGAAVLSLALYAALRRMARAVTDGARESGGRGAGGRGAAAAMPGDGAAGIGAQSGQTAGRAGLPSRSQRVKRR